MQLAIYHEYIGDQRRAADVKLYAVAETEEAMQAVINSLPEWWSQRRWRVEDWNTGKTLLKF